ncbi:MAG: hypothetical protein LBN32_01970 [Helicobacteraceae bacterium]|jgi:hypothetical protein|nr:hypothetical protein [Helicobacteraceae bacterium]
MKFATAAALLENLLKAKVDVIIQAEKGRGKTALIRKVRKNAPILHARELKEEYLGMLRSIAADNETIAIENASSATAEFLAPILATRAVLGMAFDTHFLITTRENITLDGVCKIALDPISADDYIDYAEQNQIHPSIINAIKNDENIFSRHLPSDFNTLSKLLYSRLDERYVELCISAIVGDDGDLIAAIAGTKDKKNAISNEGALNYEKELLSAVLNKSDKELEDRFMDYIKSIEANSALKMIAQLLNSPNSQRLVERALKEKDMRKTLDLMIAKIG